MDTIKKFFECLIPETVCNLKCDYCYVVQRNQNTQIIPQLDYTPEVIGRALRKERLGGTCYFSICGAGETFVPDYLIDIIFQILKNGHYVNVTTNGTLTKKIKRLESLPEEYRKRLHVSFSFHYLELKKRNLIDTFFTNVRFVQSLGCSFLVQINLYDGYIPYLEDIKKLCVDNVNALPQVAATRKEESLTKKIELMTDASMDEYVNMGKSFDSPLFDFTMKNFNKKRREFCYAGAWSYTLNLKTGVLKRCYASTIHQNIFADPEKPLLEMPVGKCCGSLFCLNSSHFLSLGVIPELNTPNYADLRNRPQANWYTKEMYEFLSGKLSSSNKTVSGIRRSILTVISWFDCLLYKTYQRLKRIR